MKKSLLFAVFSFCCTSAFSQLKIYPKVGLVIASQNLDYGDSESRDDNMIHNHVGMQVGVGLDKSLSQKVALSADLQYAQLGYIDRFKTSYQEWEDVYSLGYLLSSVSVKYDVLNEASNQAFISAGVYSGALVNGKIKFSRKEYGEPAYSSSGENRVGVNNNLGYDVLDWGIQFGGGINFYVVKHEFVMSAVYALGMPKVHEIQYTSWGRGTHAYGADGKNRFLAVSLGYVLPSPK